MKTSLNLEMKVLMVGNNPIELSKVFENLIKTRRQMIITEIAFDLKTIFERLDHFRPNYIVIDDNIGRDALQKTVKSLISFRKTKHIPITILKNSNYKEGITEGALNYILKSGITGESLYTELINSVRTRNTQLFFQKAFKKRPRQLSRIFGG